MGPSTIGIDTIYRSQGKIPEVFLRGAGVPDVFLTYIGSLVGQPIQFYSCFISYSTVNQDLAGRVHADLQSKGVRCWFAPEDLKIGDDLRPTFDVAIRRHIGNFRDWKDHDSYQKAFDRLLRDLEAEG